MNFNNKTKYGKIQEFLRSNNEPDYRIKQITNAIFKQRISRFEDMKVLPKLLREDLINNFGETVLNIKLLAEQNSEQVTKVLFEVSKNERVETVNMKYKAGWESFCISSQCGCNFGCKFCSTGDIGLKKKQNVDEIKEQIL